MSSLPDPDAPDFRVPSSPAVLVAMSHLEAMCAVDLLAFRGWLDEPDVVAKVGEELREALRGWTHRRLLQLGARHDVPPAAEDLP